jgi:hypothetical protein
MASHPRGQHSLFSCSSRCEGKGILSIMFRVYREKIVELPIWKGTDTTKIYFLCQYTLLHAKPFTGKSAAFIRFSGEVRRQDFVFL